MQRHEEKIQALRAAAITPEDVRKVGESIRRTKGGKNVREEEIISPFDIARDLREAADHMIIARRCVRRQINCPLTRKDDVEMLERLEDEIKELTQYITLQVTTMVDLEVRRTWK